MEWNEQKWNGWSDTHPQHYVVLVVLLVVVVIAGDLFTTTLGNEQTETEHTKSTINT